MADSSELVKNPKLSSCEDLYNQYHNTLVSLLDKHAPLTSKLEGRPPGLLFTKKLKSEFLLTFDSLESKTHFVLKFEKNAIH